MVLWSRPTPLQPLPALCILRSQKAFQRHATIPVNKIAAKGKTKTTAKTMYHKDFIIHPLPPQEKPNTLTSGSFHSVSLSC